MFTQNSVLQCKRYFISECQGHFAPGVKKSSWVCWMSFQRHSLWESLTVSHTHPSPQLEPSFLKTPTRGTLNRSLFGTDLIAGWQGRWLFTKVPSDTTERGTEPQQGRIPLLMQNPITIFEKFRFDLDFREAEKRTRSVKALAWL